MVAALTAAALTAAAFTAPAFTAPALTAPAFCAPALTAPALTRTGVDRSGVDRSGVDRSGVDRSGVDRTGVDRSGVLRTGVLRTGVDRSGVDRSGVDRSGVDRTGVDRSGVLRTGVDRTGVLRTGVDRTGVLRTGVDRSGVLRTGVDRTGVHRTGVDRTGVDRTGVDRTGVLRTGVDRTRVDSTGVLRTGVDRTRVLRTGAASAREPVGTGGRTRGHAALDVLRPTLRRPVPLRRHDRARRILAVGRSLHQRGQCDDRCRCGDGATDHDLALVRETLVLLAHVRTPEKRPRLKEASTSCCPSGACAPDLNRIWPNYTPPRQKLAGMPLRNRSLRNIRHHGGHQPLRGEGLGDPVQPVEQALQFVEPGPGRRICSQAPLELVRLVVGGLGVEDQVHQFGQVGRVHDLSGRKSFSSSRMRWRASNRRDFTVFSSRSRICAISW